MRTQILIAAAASAALLAGSAFAQSATDSNMSPPSATAPTTGDTAVNPAPSDPGSAMPAAPAAGPASDNATVAPAASAPAERTSADNVDIVSNGPIPDTKENRAKYGKPLSNAGRMTKPAGN